MILLCFMLSGRLSPVAADSPSTLPTPHLGYGVNVRLETNVTPLFAPLGFEWIKLWEEYEDWPPAERLPYHVLFTIECRGMPTDLDAWGDHVEAIARAGLGRVEAYEIGNEPNLARFWDNAAPDPAGYVNVLRVAYERIKAVDPDAIVVSAGLAPVGRIQGVCNGFGGNNCLAMDEREYARQMFRRGAGNYFDAFGYHPYGFAYAPEVDPLAVSNGFAFRGAEVMHRLMEEYGLGRKPLWATEFNWLRDDDDYGGVPSSCNADYESGFNWMEVSEISQTHYLTRAFHYADEFWPWMGAMFVWNLDWHNYHTWDCEAARYFSLLDSSGRPLRPYHALTALEKRPGYFGPRLAVEPTALEFLADARAPGLLTATLEVWNAGYRALTWTATVAPGGEVTPSLALHTAHRAAVITVTVDTAGYPAGVYSGAIVVSAAPDETLDAPRTVPVTLTVAQFSPRLAVEPSRLAFLADAHAPRVFTGVVRPINTGHHTLTWSARVAMGLQVSGTGSLGVQITPALAVTAGLQGEPLTVTIDSTGYTTGTYIGLIAITAWPSDTLDSPQMVTVMLRVAALRRAYLPVVLR